MDGKLVQVQVIKWLFILILIEIIINEVDFRKSKLKEIRWMYEGSQDWHDDDYLMWRSVIASNNAVRSVVSCQSWFIDAFILGTYNCLLTS